MTKVTPFCDGGAGEQAGTDAIFGGGWRGHRFLGSAFPEGNFCQLKTGRLQNTLASRVRRPCKASVCASPGVVGGGSDCLEKNVIASTQAVVYFRSSEG